MKTINMGEIEKIHQGIPELPGESGKDTILLWETVSEIWLATVSIIFFLLFLLLI